MEPAPASALAALINYLLFAQSVADRHGRRPSAVSTRMLYHLARKYDEWPGEDYEGSSCRGAMKGWFHHGVCSEMLWPYMNAKGKQRFVKPQSRLGCRRRVSGRSAPTTALRRIRSPTCRPRSTRSARSMCRPTSMADGTSAVSKKMPLPTHSVDVLGTKPDGGHAYALVGYDADGFIVQNSWGRGLGLSRLRARCSTTTGSRTAMTRGWPSWARRSTRHARHR